MKKSMKFLVLVLIGFCLSWGALGDWNATIYVDVVEYQDDCDYPTFTGKVGCEIVGGGDSDSQTWQGYHIYTFYLDAPSSGQVKGIVDLENGNDPPVYCYGEGFDSWASPSNPLEVTILPTFQ